MRIVSIPGFKFLPLAVFIILLSLSIRMGTLFYDIKEEHFLSLEMQKALAQNENKFPVSVQSKESQTLTENELLILQQLSIRREELDKRQNELNQKEQELFLLQKNLEEQQQKLNEMNKKLQALSSQSDLQENAELIRIYAHMKPSQAAALLTNLDQKLTLQILKNMPPLQAAGILGNMPEETARQLTLEMADIASGEKK